MLMCGSRDRDDLDRNGKKGKEDLSCTAQDRLGLVS